LTPSTSQPRLTPATSYRVLPVVDMSEPRNFGSAPPSPHSASPTTLQFPGTPTGRSPQAAPTKTQTAAAMAAAVAAAAPGKNVAAPTKTQTAPPTPSERLSELRQRRASLLATPAAVTALLSPRRAADPGPDAEISPPDTAPSRPEFSSDVDSLTLGADGRVVTTTGPSEISENGSSVAQNPKALVTAGTASRFRGPSTSTTTTTGLKTRAEKSFVFALFCFLCAECFVVVVVMLFIVF
jgi:hypothetical protein